MNPICEGCGRPHAPEDAFCPACGRALQGAATLPPGWLRAATGDEPDPGDPAFVPLVLEEEEAAGAGVARGAASPVVALPGSERVGWEPEVLHGADDDDAIPVTGADPRASVLALPGAATATTVDVPASGEDAAPAAAGTVPLRGARPAAFARTDVGDLPGGPGWRIRVREATEAMLSGAPLSSQAVEPAVTVPARRAPMWVYPALVTLILLTSAAAVVLLALHAVQRR